jgi:hypothetical protein
VWFYPTAGVVLAAGGTLWDEEEEVSAIADLTCVFMVVLLVG